MPRTKGALGKYTKDSKEMLHLAAQGAGGLAALTKFAKERPDVFWPLWSKLVPKEVALPEEGSAIRIVIERGDR